jgi:uncharacterized protein (DUF2249 family)/hemerythrin-like domain-containing protein
MTAVIPHADQESEDRSGPEEEIFMAAAARLGDMRQVNDAGCESILDAFDALAPGDSLLVVGDHEPRDLLRRLQADRKGLFEWSPLEAGPSCFRTAVSRRAAEPGARREVAEALAWDHDRLDILEQGAFELLAGGNLKGAQVRWAEFTLGLRRHIRFEEEILFPAFEEGLGMPAGNGPTGVMRGEHREIERLIDLIGRALAGDGTPLPLRSDLHRLLGEHNAKEEQVLYPGTDRRLGPEERDALVARIQAS